MLGEKVPRGPKKKKIAPTRSPSLQRREAKTPRHAVRRPGRRKKVGERAGCLALRACVSLSLVDTPRPLPLRRRLASSALSGGAHGFPKVGTRPSSSTPPPCAGHGAHGRPGHARLSLSLSLAYPTTHSAAKRRGGDLGGGGPSLKSRLEPLSRESALNLNPENSARGAKNPKKSSKINPPILFVGSGGVGLAWSVLRLLHYTHTQENIIMLFFFFFFRGTRNLSSSQSPP